jgi:hypothetical protein
MFTHEFYPTPLSIAQKICYMVDMNSIESVLEPSAGKADLARVIAERLNSKHSKYNKKPENIFTGLDIDTIEIEPELQYILKGYGLRVIHDDFLTFRSCKKYDLVLLNPPFSEGAKHLLKALEIQKNGGQIACILNAETLKNPFSNERKELQQKLTDYAAKVEFVQDAFVDAERKTAVEIALVYVNIDKKQPVSDIFENLKKTAEIEQEEAETEYKALVTNDYIKAAVQQYNLEVKAGIKLIQEYEAMKPYLLNCFEKPNASSYSKPQPILKLFVDISKYDSNVSLINEYIKCVRAKYWNALFNNEQFTGLLTTNLRDEYIGNVEKMTDYDFTLFNIYQIRCDMNSNMIQGVEDTILSLFDELSHKHSWYDETSKNIHYYSGWKTNKAYKINNKVIIPLSGYGTWNDSFQPTDYRVNRKLSDMEKIFNYLDGGMTREIDIMRSLKVAEVHGETKKIDCKYFLLDFYKKGTCHVTFKNAELLEKFNIFGSQKRGWLPPTYGKKQYSNMNAEEKAVVNDFQGEKAYNKTMQNQQYYLFNASSVLMLQENIKS